MIITETHANYSRGVFASPSFDLHEGTIRLNLYSVILVGGQPVEAPRHAGLIVLAPRHRIDPATGLLVLVPEEHESPSSLVGAVDWIMGKTVGQLGAQSLDASIYGLIAAQVEGFLTANGFVRVEEAE